MATNRSEKTAVGSYQNNHYALPMWHTHAGSMINILQMWVLLCKYAKCSEYESVWSYTNLYIDTSVISYRYIVTLQNEVQTYAMAWDHIGWDQTLLLLYKKTSTFWMSTLLFSALNTCMGMSYSMCIKAADAGQQHLSLSVTAYKILNVMLLPLIAVGALRRAV